MLDLVGASELVCSEVIAVWCDLETNSRASDETLEIKPTPQLQERPPQDTRAPGASNWLLRELKCLVTGS